jgi:hypothetical protein
MTLRPDNGLRKLDNQNSQIGNATIGYNAFLVERRNRAYDTAQWTLEIGDLKSE